jgi:hypothetical protein
MVQSTLQQKCENKHRQTIPEADKQKLQQKQQIAQIF